MGVLSSRRVDIEVDCGKTLKQLLREAKFNRWPAAINSKNFPFRVQPGRKEKIFIKIFSTGPACPRAWGGGFLKKPGGGALTVR